MNDDPLTHALRSLPRERAREGFTEEVLARLPAGAPRRFPRPGRLALAAALAAGVVLAPAALYLREPASPPASGQAHIDELRREQERLEQEVEELRRLAAGDLPLVYLAGDEGTDLVLDLESLAQRRPGGSIRPASYRGD